GGGSQSNQTNQVGSRSTQNSIFNATQVPWSIDYQYSCPAGTALSIAAKKADTGETLANVNIKGPAQGQHGENFVTTSSLGRIAISVDSTCQSTFSTHFGKSNYSGAG
ncbi:MAG TPA: hypothetical protein VE219_04680, partial [Candidatus Sulfotelmatobacter sp.]|nr:hypothetical protein [Candidatus Sulfotelmatobacter sp.]